MRQRRGLGKGKGKGYKNILPNDSYIHTISRLGVKTRQFFSNPFKLNRNKTLKAEGDVNLDLIDFSALEPPSFEVPSIDFTPELPSIEMPSTSDLASSIADLPPLDTGVSSGLDISMPSTSDLASQVFPSGDTTPAGQTPPSFWDTLSSDIKKGVDWEKQHLPEQKAYLEKKLEKVGAGIKKKYEDYKKASLKPKTSPEPAQRIPNKMEYVPEKYVEEDYLKNMDDDELVDYARREKPSAIFKYNKYERELLRREKNRMRFQKDFAKDTSKYATDISSNYNPLGFLMPLSTLEAKRIKHKSKDIYWKIVKEFEL